MSELVKKSGMTEEDIKLRYITPAIECKWDKNTQMRMEYNFTDGRVIVRGNVVARGKRKKADYVLYYKRNLPLAIVEAKDNKHSVGAGMQQGIDTKLLSKLRSMILLNCYCCIYSNSIKKIECNLV